MKISVFLFVVFIFCAPQPQNETFSWMVIPNKVTPTISPSSKSVSIDTVLSYPQVLTGHVIFSQQDSSRWLAVQIGADAAYVPLKTVVRLRHPEAVQEINSFRLTDIQFPLSLSYKPPNLVRLSQKWNFHQKDYTKFMRQDAALALEKMLIAAEKADAHMRVMSAYRSAEHQRRLYLLSLKEDHGDLISVAKPGYSEHQLGIVADLCNLNPKSVFHPEFDLCVEGQWLKAHAREYGFEQSYTKENMYETGVIPEPWHFRYIGDLDSIIQVESRMVNQ